MRLIIIGLYLIYQVFKWLIDTSDQMALEEDIRKKEEDKRLKEENRIEKIKEKRKEGLKGYVEEIYYLSGHEEISLPQRVDIYLYKDKITFYKAGSINLLFIIRSDQIENIKYDKIEGGPRELIVRLSGYSIPMEDITQVIIIEYIKDEEEYIKNQRGYMNDQEIKYEIAINTGNQEDKKLYKMIKTIADKG